MAHEVKLTMDGLLINWLKNVGEAVSSDDIIAEFEADKATVEVEAGVVVADLEDRGAVHAGLVRGDGVGDGLFGDGQRPGRGGEPARAHELDVSDVGVALGVRRGRRRPVLGRPTCRRLGMRGAGRGGRERGRRRC